MAVFVVCAVRDAALDAFFPPIFVRSTGEAMRSFMDEVNRDGSPMQAHPSDYELFLIGSYDDADASIVVHAPSSLITGKACVRNKEQ